MEAKEKIERFVFVTTNKKNKAKECYFMLSFKYNITEANSTGRILFMQRILFKPFPSFSFCSAFFFWVSFCWLPLYFTKTINFVGIFPIIDLLL